MVALAALIAAAVVIFLLLSGGDSPYRVTAHFENASQLVKGNEVVIGGTAVGLVDEIELGDNGEALVTFHRRREPRAAAARAPRPPSAPSRSRASPTARSS